MERTYIPLILILILSFNPINASMEPFQPFCENQGYEVVSEKNDYYCLFDDGNKCQLLEFYDGECGSGYIKEFPCKKLGEYVFPQFEECCEGKPYIHPFHGGQKTCQPLHKRLIGSLKYNLILNPIIHVLGLFTIFLLILIIVKKRRKK